MKYAVMSFQTDFAVRPDELARGVEERGFGSSRMVHFRA